jgi:hypothetical protein
MASRRVIENNELKAQIKALEERNKELEWSRRFLMLEFRDHIDTVIDEITLNGLSTDNGLQDWLKTIHPTNPLKIGKHYIVSVPGHRQAGHQSMAVGLMLRKQHSLLTRIGYKALRSRCRIYKENGGIPK